MRTDADGEMIAAGKRPEVARLLGHGLDGDRGIGDAVDEEAGRDRQLCARERGRELPPEEAGRAIGAEHMLRFVLLAIGPYDHGRAAPEDVNGLFWYQPGTRVNRGVHQRAIEHGAADDHERAVGGRAPIDQRHVRCGAGRTAVATVH